MTKEGVCPSCKHEGIREHDNFCSHCAADLRGHSFQCECGLSFQKLFFELNPADAKEYNFCPRCGREIKTLFEKELTGK